MKAIIHFFAYLTSIWGLFGQSPPPPVIANPSPAGLPSARSTKIETVERAGLDLGDPKEGVRLGAAKLLGKYKTTASLAFLTNALDDPSVRVRRAAVVSFSEFLLDGFFINDRSYLEKFLSKIGDSDVEVRRQVSQMLSRMSIYLNRSRFQIIESGGRKVYKAVPYALPPALSVIGQRAFLDDDPIVRQNMLKYFYTLRIVLPPLTLERLLKDEDRGVQMAALDRVNSMGPHPGIFRTLRELTEHDDVGVRQKIASIARSSSHPIAREILRALRDDGDPYVMSLAVISLARLGELQPNERVAKVREFLLSTSSTSNQVISLVYAVAAFGNAQARETFKALTDHNSAKIRRIAWQRFLNYDNGWSNPDVWLQALKDPDRKTREGIISVAVSRARSFTPKVMTTLIESPHVDVRRFAADCLALVLPSLAEEFEFDLLIDEKVEVRVAALRSVGITRPAQWTVIMERSLKDDELLIQRIAVESLLNDRSKGFGILVRFAQQNADKPISASIRAELARRNVLVP